MDTAPATYSDFLREMRTMCNPQSCNLPKFETACEAMWYDGVLAAMPLGKLAGVSRPTAIGWVNAAKQLGLAKHMRRPRSAAHEKQAAKQRESVVKMTTEEMRAHLVSKLLQTFDTSEDASKQAQLTTALASMVPGLKAPETRLDVQILIGRDNIDRIEDGLAENLKWIMGNDRDFGLRLLEKAGLSPALPRAEEVADAEIADVDDEPSPNEPQLSDDSSDRG